LFNESQKVLSGGRSLALEALWFRFMSGYAKNITVPKQFRESAIS
jgi:hypothetical protein